MGTTEAELRLQDVGNNKGEGGEVEREDPWETKKRTAVEREELEERKQRNKG